LDLVPEGYADAPVVFEFAIALPDHDLLSVLKTLLGPSDEIIRAFLDLRFAGPDSASAERPWSESMSGAPAPGLRASAVKRREAVRSDSSLESIRRAPR
jgi:hypothetical protein